MMFLIQDVTLLGHIQLPLISLLGALGLIAASAVTAWRLVIQTVALRRTVEHISRRVARLLTMPADEIDEVRLRKLTEIFDHQTLVATPWTKYRRSLLLDNSRWYENPKVHATQPAGEVFTPEALFVRLNLSFYRSFPAMLTGAGLLLTFVAFFIGLSKIQIVGTTVSGLPGLINGLSGKFVTSIVGLFCASIFLVVEKVLLHRLLSAYQAMVDRLDQVFPHRTATDLLFEMTQHQGENARLLKYLGLDLSQHFRKSLTEAMTAMRGLGGSGAMIAPANVMLGLSSTSADNEIGLADLGGVFDKLEASAVRQEQLHTRLADILLPWTDILPKTRLPGNISTMRRPATTKSAAASGVSQNA
jgi:hypothetical protein